MKPVVKNNQPSLICQEVDNQYPFDLGVTCFSIKPRENVDLLKVIKQSVQFSLIFLGCCLIPVIAQQFNQPQFSAQMQQPNNNYLRNSTAFRQEIARFEMTVHREGKAPLSLSQVPRVQQGDVIKVRLLDEAVSGVKLDQSLYNWTLLVAFVNPNRKVSGSGSSSSSLNKNGSSNSKFGNSFAGDNSGKNVKSDKESSVSEEIQFRKKGWYKEHSFVVPYDSQPIFFLYPKPNYRGKILNLINKNYKEIRALGEKTIELAGAYGQISLFLNELQSVISGNNNYGSGYGGGYGGGYGNNNYYGGSTGNYGGTTGNFGNYGGYNPSNNRSPNQNYNQPFNFNLFIAQAVERMARGFNINLPNNCWQGSNSFATNQTYNPYGNYGSSGILQPTISPELVTRLQCVAKGIRLEDFDLSVSKLLQQGGMLLAIQLQQKYPQLSYWINVAALAIDLIVKIAKKSPLRIVPAVSSSSDNPNAGSYGVTGSYQSSQSFQNSYNSGNSANSGNSPNSAPMPKISLFAESQPDDNQFVTAYPIILHKWQAEPDAEVISLRPPVLMEPCLHTGVNILKSTDLTDDQLADTFTKDYKLTMSSTNGFRKEFPLKKNLGLNGWELNISPQDLQEFPKIQMSLESTIKGTRGFNEIKSPAFFLPISIGGSWQMTPESQQNFTVGGKRTISIRNTLGNCQCLQAVIYKPSFGGQFVFESDSKDNNRLTYSPDGKEVSFEVDATNFQAGAGEIELRTYGGESAKLPLKLYPAPPNITEFKIRRGDREILLTGERLEQVQSVSINGRRAINPYQTAQSSSQTQGYGNQPNYQQPNSGQPSQPSYSQPNSYQNQPNSVTSVNSGNSGNSGNTLTSTNYPQNTLSQNQKVFVFQDSKSQVEGNQVSLELGFEDNRSFTYPQRVNTLASRPAIVAGENNEIVGTFLKSQNTASVQSLEFGVQRNNPIQQSTANAKTIKKVSSIPNPKPETLNTELNSNEIVSIESAELTISIQNKLTDFNFRTENLSIETGVEGSTVNPNELPQVRFDVLDTSNLRLNISIPQTAQKYLGGRRIKFRIRDRERGESDWYVIKQTFVRFPKIEAVKCTIPKATGTQSKNLLNKGSVKNNGVPSPTPYAPNPNPLTELPCQISGIGLDYINQVSIDGGVTWYPQSPNTLQAQLTSDGKSTAMIPLLNNKKSLMIKLRDYPKLEGLFMSNFVYSGLGVVPKKLTLSQ